MNMYNPPHPGEVLKQLCLEPLIDCHSGSSIPWCKPEGSVWHRQWASWSQPSDGDPFLNCFRHKRRKLA